MANCPYCGKLTDPKLEGCPHCGANLQKSAAPGPRSKRNRQTCPNCKAMVQEGDIICVVCGTNLLTGQKITEEARARERSSTNVPLIVGGVIAIAVVLVAAGSWLYVSNRDPYNQAKALMEKQQFLEAQEKMQEHVDQVPTDVRALYDLGRLQWRNNQFGPAAGSFERVVEINPTDSRAAMWAVVAIEQSGGTRERARQIDLLERVVRAEPDNATAWYLLAMARATQDDVAGQIEALERVLALGQFQAPAQQGLGIALALRGDYTGAERELDKADTLTESPDLVALKAFVASMRGATQDAAGLFAEAIAIPGVTLRGEALTQLGKIQLEQGRFQEATRSLEEAMNLRPNNDLAKYLKALSLQASGYLQDALTDFEELARGRGTYAQQSAVQVADIYMKLGNADRARQAIDNAAEISSSGAQYFTVRGRVLAASGDAAGAQTSYRQAMNSDPGYAPAYLESGLLHVKSEALEQGLRDLDTYLDLLGPDANSREVEQIRELTNQLRQTTAG